MFSFNNDVGPPHCFNYYALRVFNMFLAYNPISLCYMSFLIVAWETFSGLFVGQTWIAPWKWYWLFLIQLLKLTSWSQLSIPLYICSKKAQNNIFPSHLQTLQVWDIQQYYMTSKLLHLPFSMVFPNLALYQQIWVSCEKSDCIKLTYLRTILHGTRLIWGFDMRKSLYAIGLIH